MLSKSNIYKGLLTNRPKTPFSRQSQLVNQHESPFIELQGAHFLLSEATALVEFAPPLSEVQNQLRAVQSQPFLICSNCINESKTIRVGKFVGDAES